VSLCFFPEKCRARKVYALQSKTSNKGDTTKMLVKLLKALLKIECNGADNRVFSSRVIAYTCLILASLYDHINLKKRHPKKQMATLTNEKLPSSQVIKKANFGSGVYMTLFFSKVETHCGLEGIP
jgi:hypothetical protein